ncbi:MAG: hypothetical protein ACTSRT_03180, partial [Promethearchaeota archaeon]
EFGIDMIIHSSSPVLINFFLSSSILTSCVSSIFFDSSTSRLTTISLRSSAYLFSFKGMAGWN